MRGCLLLVICVLWVDSKPKSSGNTETCKGQLRVIGPYINTLPNHWIGADHALIYMEAVAELVDRAAYYPGREQTTPAPLLNIIPNVDLKMEVSDKFRDSSS